MKLDPCQGKTANKYKEVKLKLLKTNENIKFNKKCLDYGLVPNYVNIRIKNNSNAAKKTLISAQIQWIKNEIKSLYCKKSLLNQLLFETHLELLNKLHPAQHDILSTLESQVTSIINKKRDTQNKKIERLLQTQIIQEKVSCKHKFFPTVTNLTKINFDKNEMKLLNKGMNFNFPNNKKTSFLQELFQAEAVIKSLQTEDVRNNTRVIVNRKAKALLKDPIQIKQTTNRYKSERQVATGIRDKLAANEAMITKADKGNSLVILYSYDYIDKVETFLNENKINKIDTDPTPNFSKEINKIISQSKNLLTPVEINFSKVTNPSAPCLKGLPKIHKTNMPIRPLVNFISSPTYNISKRLEYIIKNQVILENSRSLRNSIELIQRINSAQPSRNYILASFDIVNLYTNVPVNETIKILHRNLTKNSTLTPSAINELITLTKAVLKQNYFKFNNQFYSQTDGLAMGSPLSGILAEIFLNSVENTHLWSNNNQFLNKILFYCRYVDDTLVMFNGSIRQLNLFKNYLNKIHPNVKFTLETEENHSINYLDLTIFKDENALRFKIYRKPTTTAQTIHASSHHPYNQKMAAYNSFVHRLLSVPLNQEDYNDEVATIKYIAVQNGYKSSIVDKLINKRKKPSTPPVSKPYESTTIINKNNKFVSMEFGSTSLNYTVKNELAKNDVTVSFKTNNKLGSILKPRPTEKKSLENYTGVYKISCDDCPKFYIGQTTRSFKTRFKEHLPTKKSKTRSAYAAHLIDNNHNYTDFQKNVNILNINNKKGRMLDCLEEFHIYKAMKTEPHNVLNEQVSFKSNAIYNTAISIVDTDGRCRDKRHYGDNN